MSELIRRPTPTYTYNKFSQNDLKANIVKALTIQESTYPPGVSLSSKPCVCAFRVRGALVDPSCRCVRHTSLLHLLNDANAVI
jgi:hypothetical protein